MNSEHRSLIDNGFATWKGMSPAGKMLAGGTALIWLLWLFWLPIAQDMQTADHQTFRLTITEPESTIQSDTEAKSEEINHD